MLGLESAFGSNCELILVPTHRERGVTPKAYAAFYELMIAYRYPMRYLEQNQAAIRKLNTTEKTLLTNDELSFIKKKFKEQYPRYASDLKIQAIPKSLYQLHAYVDNLNYQMRSIVNSYSSKKNLRTMLPSQLSSIDFRWENTWSNSNKPKYPFEQYCYLTLQNKTVCDQHYKINQYIVQKEEKIKLMFSKDDLQNPTEEDIIKAHLQELRIDIKTVQKYHSNTQDDFDLYALLNKYLCNQDKNKIYLMISNPNTHDAFMSFTGDMTLLEWSSRQKPNIHYIYQGMGVQIHRREKRGQTLSYGDGFFGGGVQDSLTAMAYSYVAGTKKANNFSITELWKTLSESKEQVIYNPRITTLINLHGKGEFHHPRSKVPTTYNFKVQEGIQGLRFVKNPEQNLSFLVAEDIPANEVEKRVNDYQKEYSIELVSKIHHAPVVDIPIGSIEQAKITQIDEKKLVGHSLFKERQVQQRKSEEFKIIHMQIKDSKQKLNKINLQVKEITKETLDRNFFMEKYIHEVEKKINHDINDMISYIKNFEIDAKKRLPLVTNEVELNQLKHRIDFLNNTLIGFKHFCDHRELIGADDLTNEANQYLKNVFQSRATGIQETLSNWNVKIENKRKYFLPKK